MLRKNEMVISNIQICKDWLSLTASDWQSVNRAVEDKNVASAMFHLQFYVEKLLKSLISIFAKEALTNHFPSKQLNQIIEDETIKIDQENISVIQRIIILSRSLEDERTRPRYGVRHSNRIVSPEEIYTMETIQLFYDDAKTITQLLIGFYRSLPFSDLLETELKKLEDYL